MLFILEGVAANLHNIAFAMKFDNNLLRQCPTIVYDLVSEISYSSKEMFEWRNNKCVLKTLETRQSLNLLPSFNPSLLSPQDQSALSKSVEPNNSFTSS